MEKTTLTLNSFIVELITEQTDSLDFWKWKTDSFKTVSDPHTLPDVRIHLYPGADRNKTGPQNLELLLSQKSGFYTYTAYRGYDGETFWLVERPAKKQRILSFTINPDWDEIRLNEDTSGTAGQLAFEMLSRILPGVFLKKNILQLHAALVEDQGRGIAVCADSGVGKTTHARLWRNTRNAIIIDGDRATCVRDENGWTAFGIPWCGTSGEYMNRSVPLRAVVLLERGETNSVCRLSELEAFFKVIHHLQYPQWDSQLRNKGMDLVQQLIEDVPVFCLTCRPDAEAVEVLNQVL